MNIFIVDDSILILVHESGELSLQFKVFLEIVGEFEKGWSFFYRVVLKVKHNTFMKSDPLL